jgi:hypothetical protein
MVAARVDVVGTGMPRRDLPGRFWFVRRGLPARLAEVCQGTLRPPARGGPAGRDREAAPDGWFAHHAAPGRVESPRPTGDPGHRTHQRTEQPPVRLGKRALA